MKSINSYILEKLILNKNIHSYQKGEKEYPLDTNYPCKMVKVLKNGTFKVNNFKDAIQWAFNKIKSEDMMFICASKKDMTKKVTFKPFDKDQQNIRYGYEDSTDAFEILCSIGKENKEDISKDTYSKLLEKLDEMIQTNNVTDKLSFYIKGFDYKVVEMYVSYSKENHGICILILVEYLMSQ